MKKSAYLFLSSLTLFTLLFFLTSTTKTITSSSATTLNHDYIQYEINTHPDFSFAPMPTMPPFPEVKIHYFTPHSSPTSFPSPTAGHTSNPRPTFTSEPINSPAQVAESQPNRNNTQKIIELVNAERIKVKLEPLTENQALTKSAQQYSEYMGNNDFFSHTGTDGSTFITRNKAAGYTNYRWMGENLAAGQKTPEQAIRDWMVSPGHRANVLNKSAKEIGVGYANISNSTYRYYWVQEFGSSY